MSEPPLPKFTALDERFVKVLREGLYRCWPCNYQSGVPDIQDHCSSEAHQKRVEDVVREPNPARLNLMAGPCRVIQESVVRASHLSARRESRLILRPAHRRRPVNRVPVRPPSSRLKPRPRTSPSQVSSMRTKTLFLPPRARLRPRPPVPRVSQCTTSSSESEAPPEPSVACVE